LIPLQQAIEEFQISQATLFRWLQQGRLKRYRQPGKGNVTWLDPAELRRALKPRPVTKGR
jgi:predicted site-specific integrase-resolvase